MGRRIVCPYCGEKRQIRHRLGSKKAFCRRCEKTFFVKEAFAWSQ